MFGRPEKQNFAQHDLEFMAQLRPVLADAHYQHAAIIRSLTPEEHYIDLDGAGNVVEVCGSIALYAVESGMLSTARGLFAEAGNQASFRAALTRFLAVGYADFKVSNDHVVLHCSLNPQPRVTVENTNLRISLTVPGGTDIVEVFSWRYQLTAREQQVCRALVAGLSLPEFAQSSGISVQTARTHMKHIVHKTGAKSQLKLVAMIHGCAIPD